MLTCVLWVLGSGAVRYLQEKYPFFQTCHRRLQKWVRNGRFEETLKQLAKHLREQGKLYL